MKTPDHIRCEAFPCRDSNRGTRVFPSYLQTGGNYLIEQSKRAMIAEDLREALGIARDI